MNLNQRSPASVQVYRPEGPELTDSVDKVGKRYFLLA
jgi:hypothetical protein